MTHMSQKTLTNRLFVTFLLVAAPAAAQPAKAPTGSPAGWPQEAKTFEQLQMLVRPNDTVTVRDAAGATLRGRIADLSATSLRLVDKNPLRTFALADVVEVRVRRQDSLANGAKIGAGVGAALATISIIALCAADDDSGCSGWIVLAVGPYAAMGAGMGVAVDAMRVRERTVFRAAPAGSVAHRVQIAPVLGGGRKGVALRLTF
jgi:hypothetical protein